MLLLERSLLGVLVVAKVPGCGGVGDECMSTRFSYPESRLEVDRCTEAAVYISAQVLRVWVLACADASVLRWSIA